MRKRPLSPRPALSTTRPFVPVCLLTHELLSSLDQAWCQPSAVILRAVFVLVVPDHNVFRECLPWPTAERKVGCPDRKSFLNMNVLDQRNSTQAVVEIAVGGKRKGFHSVALFGGGLALQSYRFLDRARASRNRASATKNVTKITSR